MNRRVVITGAGAITSLGQGADALHVCFFSDFNTIRCSGYGGTYMQKLGFAVIPDMENRTIGSCENGIQSVTRGRVHGLRKNQPGGNFRAGLLFDKHIVILLQYYRVWPGEEFMPSKLLSKPLRIILISFREEISR